MADKQEITITFNVKREKTGIDYVWAITCDPEIAQPAQLSEGFDAIIKTLTPDLLLLCNYIDPQPQGMPDVTIHTAHNVN